MLLTISYNRSSRQEFVFSDKEVVKKIRHNDSNIDVFSLPRVEANTKIIAEIPRSRANDLDKISFALKSNPRVSIASIDCQNANRGLLREITVPTSEELLITVVRKSAYNSVYELRLDIVPPTQPLRLTYSANEDPGTITFTAEGGKQPWSIDFGDSSPIQILESNVVSHTYTTSGTYSSTIIDADSNQIVVVFEISLPTVEPEVEPEPAPKARRVKKAE